MGLFPVLVRQGVDVEDEFGRVELQAVEVRLPATLAVGNLIYPPIVSPSGLLIAIILAVFKPWGLIRKNRVPTRAAG